MCVLGEGGGRDRGREVELFTYLERTISDV